MSTLNQSRQTQEHSQLALDAMCHHGTGHVNLYSLRTTVDHQYISWLCWWQSIAKVGNVFCKF